MPPLLPRPALMLFSYTTSALSLLEHAVWAHATGEATAQTDVEVFRRWIEEAGFKAAVDDYVRVSRDSLNDGRSASDKDIVYGTSASVKAEVAKGAAAVRAHL